MKKGFRTRRINNETLNERRRNALELNGFNTSYGRYCDLKR